MRVLAALLVAASVLTVQDPQQRPLFRGGARFVRVDVYPTDSEGKPITDLTAADFELFEDRKPQRIDTFDFVRIEPEPEIARVDPNSQKEGEALARDPRARVFAIVLDTRHVDLPASREMRRPLTGMLDRLIGPRDLFGVITPELPASSFVLGRRTTTVADMMSRHWTWGADESSRPQDPIEAMFAGCFGSRESRRGAVTQELVGRYRERQTLEHLSNLIEKLQHIREERKVAIIVTRGWRLLGRNEGMAKDVGEMFGGSMPRIGQQGGNIQLRKQPQHEGDLDTTDCYMQANTLLMMDFPQVFRELLTKAERANVAFYPIDPRGVAPFDDSINHSLVAPSEEINRVTSRAGALRTLAANTGGIALVANNDLDNQFKRLADSLSTYYLLGYYSTNAKFDGGYRRLDVKVKRPGVRVNARRGYFAPTEEEMAAIAAGREAKPPAAERVALDGALARLADVRHDRDLFLQAAAVPGGLVISAELGVNARTSPAWSDGGEVKVTVTAAGTETVETRAIPAMRSGVTLRIALAEPGAARIEAKARAKRPGDSGAADASLQVTESETLIGDVLSHRGIARALTPAADGRYRRTERATIEAPLRDGAVPAGARVLDITGKPLNVPIAVRERADAGGARWLVAELVLAPLTDGDYVIEMEVMKDATREKKLFAIRVVR